jgi:hypothetical protein
MGRSDVFSVGWEMVSRMMLVSVILLLGGCSDEEPRTVPQVAEPVDLGMLATSPCQSLSETEYKGLGIPGKGGETHNRKEGRLVCLWDDSSPATQLQFVPYSDKPILRDVYEHTPGDVARFETFEADGFPAVAVVVEEASGTCTVTVGVSESQGFQFVHLAETGSRACGRAKDAAWVVAQDLRSRR